MATIFNPLTGDFIEIPEGVLTPDTYKVDKFTLSSTDIINKYVVLTDAPLNTTKTRVVVIKGIEQDYGTDFIMTVDDDGKRLSWNGLGLENILEINDKLVVVYF